MELTDEKINLVNIVDEYFGKSIVGEEQLQLMNIQRLFDKLQTLGPSDK